MTYNRQVGGTHYKRFEVHPDEFCMINCWDADAFSIVKYVSRHRDKNGEQDIDKALHFLDRRIRNFNYQHRIQHNLSMNAYCQMNGIEGDDQMALFALYAWVCFDHGPDSLRKILLRLKAEYQ